jgi:beta-lactam-binding protein with PASTA domain/predicted Ser/Thr protein kinase
MSTTVSDPLVGRLLDQRYQVTRRLARGGMATVYEATDTRLDRTIAVKVMHSGLAEDREFVARFIREARSAARLSHPNVVAVYDQGTDDGHVFLAMEYVHGRTLRDLLREKQRLTPREACNVIEPVLAALEAAHRAGIVHRDVKPENVLIAEDGRVKVADFGLARAVSTTTTSGSLIGTVAYLAPEQVERGIADPRSDVYAAGIVLFELLTGSKPFSGDSPIQVAYQHVHRDVPPPSSLLPTLPPALDALVTGATRRDPDQRPRDASAFLAATTQVHRSLSAQVLDAGVGLADRPAGNGSAANGGDRTLVVSHTTHRRGDGEDTAVVAPGPSGEPDPYAPSPAFATRRRRGPFALVAVLLAALLVGGTAWWLGSGRYVSTPSLIDMDRAAAQATAARERLTLRFATAAEFSETVPADRVLRTDPKPGRRITRGGTIVAVLSKGPERYAVPRLAGLDEDEAEAKLAAAHLSLGGVRREYHGTVDEDTVIRSEPGQGQRLRRDTAVALVLSRGPEPVQLPDVIGKTLDEAMQLLRSLGFRVQSDEVFHGQVPGGQVVRQRPAGDSAPRGSTVTLAVSKGPQLVAVPRVIGLPVNRAKRVLERSGFQVRVMALPGGPRRVLAQNPVEGSQQPMGSLVTISVF